MADEDLDFEENPQEIEQNKAEKRIKDLSEKVKITATERDELATAKAEAEAAKDAALKDAEFYKNFSAVSTKYTGAGEYQDQIREKVNAGYDLEDAAVSVLNKEGKLTPQTEKPESPAGGSSINTLPAGDKTIADMTQAERRAILAENLDIT